MVLIAHKPAEQDSLIVIPGTQILRSPLGDRGLACPDDASTCPPCCSSYDLGESTTNEKSISRVPRAGGGDGRGADMGRAEGTRLSGFGRFNRKAAFGEDTLQADVRDKAMSASYIKQTCVKQSDLLHCLETANGSRRLSVCSSGGAVVSQRKSK